MTESTQDEDRALASEGQASQPEGDGPVTLEDRTKPGGAGSPDTNQGKTEPLSPQPDHPDPLAVPELSDMNVGAGDPQAPSRPGADATAPAGSYGGGRLGEEPTDLSGPGADADAQRREVDSTTSTGRAPGPEVPEQESTGTAHRATGIQGDTPAGESVAVDTEAGATRMGAAPPDSVPGLSSGQGDANVVPTSGSAPAPGTSENQPKVEGIRLPETDDPGPE